MFDDENVLDAICVSNEYFSHEISIFSTRPKKKEIDFRNEMKILPREKLTHGFMDIAKVSF